MSLLLNSNLTLNDFKEIENIESHYYSSDTIAFHDQMMSWHDKNSDVFITVRDSVHKKIVGSITLLPFSKEQYKIFIEENFKITEINKDSLLTYRNNEEYYLCFSSITIAKEYRKHPFVLYFLLKGLYKKIEELKKNGIHFINMCAEGQTEDGKQFICDFLDLELMEKTKDDYCLYHYKNDYIDFSKWFLQLPIYIDNYFKDKKLGYKMETHLHTLESSCCSNVDVDRMLTLYSEKEYKTICITDHYSLKNLNIPSESDWEIKIDYLMSGFKKALLKSKELNINILFGIELTLIETESHYLIYGITEEFLRSTTELYDLSLKDLVELCNKNNFLLVQAHPFRDEIQVAPIEYQMITELYNGCSDENSRNQKSLSYILENNLIGTSGSDFHNEIDCGKGGIITLNEIETIPRFIECILHQNYEIVKNESYGLNK